MTDSNTGRTPQPPQTSAPAVATQGSMLQALYRLISPSRTTQKPEQGQSNSPNSNQDVSVTSDAKAPVDQLESFRRTANLVDKYMDAKHAENMRNRVKRDKEHLNLSISPENPHWSEIREKLMIALKSNSIHNILHDKRYNFTEEDILLFVPPPTEGALLNLQRKNTEKYQKNMGPGGRFEGQNDNVITKLAMLYFGLPVAPLTERNCINAGIDEVDKPDDPNELPRVQRIMYAEKPLEFLDLYHERGYGFPMLRRPKPRRVVGAKNRRTFLPRAKRDNHLRNGRLGSGILPRTEASKKVTMRGGAGPSVDLAESHSYYQPNLRGGGDVERVDDFWLYCSLGSTNKKIKLAEETKKDDPEDFKRKALFLLGLSDTGEWSFHVDQYRNQEDHKKNTRKEFVKTFNINRRTYKDRYRQYLKARLYNPLGDWPMFVRPMGTSADESVSIEDYEETKYSAVIDLTNVKGQQKRASSSALSPGKSPNKQKTKSSAKADRLPKVSSRPETKQKEASNEKSVIDPSTPLADRQTNVLQSRWRLVYSLDEVHMFAAFEDDARSFRRAVDTGVLTDIGDKSFLVSFYATQTDGLKEKKIYSGTIKYPPGLADGVYKQFIRPRSFGAKHDDTAIIAHHKQEVPEYWPPGGHRLVQVSMITPKAELRTTSVLHWQDGSSVIMLDNSFRAFSDAIRKMTRRHDLVADIYSNRKSRSKPISHDSTLDLSVETLESLYNDCISRFLFGPNIEDKVVIRAKTEPRRENWFFLQEDTKSIDADIQGNTVHPVPPTRPIRNKIPPVSPSQPTRDNVPPVPPTNMNTTNLAQVFNPTGVRINQERFLRPQVKRPIPLKFDTWTQEESRLDRLRQQGYTKPQSVVEPGQKPAAPFFGPSRELALKVSSNLPTIYTQRITPTDVSQLLEENVFLRNALLERRSSCDLCGMSFAAYEPEQKQAHTKEHLDCLRNAGNCPLCDADRWVFMDTQQRRQHLWEHQHAEESQLIKDFWNDLICPVCDEPLHNETAEYIISHLIQHEPDSLAYCDRCGIHLNRLTPAEIAHHDHETHAGACQPNLPPERWSEFPEFCTICGRDKTNLTEEQRLDHQNHCVQSESLYCKQCGFDMSTLDLNELNGVERHNAACKTPRGFKRKFCQRCGKNKSIMTAGELATHSNECFEGSTYLPPLENLNWRPGHNNRETALNAREKDLHRREAEFARKKYAFESGSGGGSAVADAAVGIVNSEFRIDTCPNPHCELTGDELTAMTKEEFFNHMLDHDHNFQFRCPLINIVDDTASVCGRLITVDDPSFKAHYIHKSYTDSPPSPNAERLKNTLRLVRDQYDTLVVAQPMENETGEERGARTAKRKLQDEDNPETSKKRLKTTESEKIKEANTTSEIEIASATETRRSKRLLSAPAPDHPPPKFKTDARQVNKPNVVISTDELDELEEGEEPATPILGKRKRVAFEKSADAPVKAATKKKPTPKKAVTIPKRSEGAPVKAKKPPAPRKRTREKN